MRVKKLYADSRLPEKGSEFAAGFDLFAHVDEPVTIHPHETVMISTGLAMEIPEGYFGGIYARSGIASKKGLRPANCTGVVDADYRGEVFVSLHNDSDEYRTISSGDRIAQLIIHKFFDMPMEVATELSETVRGSGGFGSTGK